MWIREYSGLDDFSELTGFVGLQIFDSTSQAVALESAGIGIVGLAGIATRQKPKNMKQ
ncbi:MAG: hypothetical protein HOI47_07305 [Candidatus Scalindua sp.]|nr:hypothetical protein [Candidatus Scalindua sp.]MBT6226447.1 hypothetical protein [Candidatus Scalindua sp.]